jgi:uncharacterized protein (DUF1810 family)
MATHAASSEQADPFNLGRFVDAQDAGGAYGRALGELRDGYKVSHWMWFIFPQVAGLGMSQTSKRFAISSIEEARAYSEHRVLGSRLLHCAEALLRLEGLSAEEVLGSVDAQKLRSSMTLFARAEPDEPVYERVLERYFGGRADPATDRLLRADR